MSGACVDVGRLLSAWLDGELRPEERVVVRAHLERCHACREELEQVRWVRSLARSMPVRVVPERLAGAAAVRAAGGRVEAPEEMAARAGGWATLLRRAGVSAAVMLGLLAGAAYSLGGPPPDARTVRVPLDLYVADHLVHTVHGPVTTPVFSGTDR